MSTSTKLSLTEYRSRNTPEEPWQPWSPIPPHGYVPIVKFSLLYPQLWQIRKPPKAP